MNIAYTPFLIYLHTNDLYIDTYCFLKFCSIYMGGIEKNMDAIHSLGIICSILQKISDRLSTTTQSTDIS